MTTEHVPPTAQRLHQQARQLGAAGNYEQAIDLLARAQQLAPDWPYPSYDLAFTYLLMYEFDKARQYYAQTVNLSPRGFFTAITALETLDREAAGELPSGTYILYLSLEWIDDPQEKAARVAELVQGVPQFAPGWYAYASQCSDAAEKLKALDQGLAAAPDAETRGMLLINKALVLHQQGQQQAAVEILGDITGNPHATISSEALARQTLSMIRQ